MADSVQGRSVVAMAYAKLVREWTVRTNNPWHIKTIYSAGIRIQDSIADVQESIEIPMMSGNKPPTALALDALFDNRLFNYPYKEQIQKETHEYRLRGLKEGVFRNHDYIFLFNRHDRTRMERLREAMVAKRGAAAVRPNRGKLVLLGEYEDPAKATILDPPNTREGWNRTMGRIKISFKKFIIKELGWVQPPKGQQPQ